MFYIADLHLHSRYARATSRDLTPESLYQWARIKGIHVVGTGDFTHPLWLKELQEKLQPDGSGFYRLKHPPADLAGFRCADTDIRFCLTTEISSIYKFDGRIRKNHNCVFAPDFNTVMRFNAKLAQIGNLAADGRPILGLASRDLLEMVLETSDQMHLIPAHVWTPWFSTFGSKSGYDSIEACFRDLISYIFALETGLSSDPAMNWRWSALDRFALVSNSDAHSPQNLGREANLFHTERSYQAMFAALKTRKGFLGTYEFFPEEGKYHLDGHRKCEVCLSPEESERLKNVCPHCGQPLTVGVLHRVITLADRLQPRQPDDAAPFQYIIPLPEILSEIRQSSPNSKAVQQYYQQLISSFGNEFMLLHQVPIEDIEKKAGFILAEAIRRMRQQQVYREPGYDGVYGIIRIFQPGELHRLSMRALFVDEPEPLPSATSFSQEMPKIQADKYQTGLSVANQISLDADQLAASEASGAVLVVAGPGTGKTRTLISWMIYQMQQKGVHPSNMLGITFTQKAAEEIKQRLYAAMGKQAVDLQVGTFHAVAFSMLQKTFTHLQQIYDEEDRRMILGLLYPDKTADELKHLSDTLADYFEGHPGNDPSIPHLAQQYLAYTWNQGGIDLSSLIYVLLKNWEEDTHALNQFRKQYTHVAVDELQDINPQQYAFLQMLAKGQHIFAIGDPDQCIYQFRGSDLKLFFQFKEDFQAREFILQHNYRSTGIIVEAAEKLIAHNRLHKQKCLQAQKPAGERIQLIQANDAYEEADWIAQEIEQLMGGWHQLSGNQVYAEGKYGFSDIAILFRTRTAYHALVPKFRQLGIPLRFSDSSSPHTQYPFQLLADVIRVYLNPHDRIALDRLLMQGFQMDRTQREAFVLAHAPEEILMVLLGEAGVAAFSRGVMPALDFLWQCWKIDEIQDDAVLLWKETLRQLAKESDDDFRKFLALWRTDRYVDAGRLHVDALSLLTFHAAKGLEFPVVFILGAEEGITPVHRADADIEEERRLFYVALTRAKEKLYITWAARRKQYAEIKQNRLSRFVTELPATLIEHKVIPKPVKIQQLKLFS